MGFTNQLPSRGPPSCSALAMAHKGPTKPSHPSLGFIGLSPTNFMVYLHFPFRKGPGTTPKSTEQSSAAIGRRLEIPDLIAVM